MFFSSKDGEATAAVQDGIAYVLGQDAASRTDLHKFIGELYDYRSRTSHEGADFDVPEKLRELKDVTLNFLATIIRRRDESATKKALKEWVFAARMN
jgi:hypothetical protein